MSEVRDALPGDIIGDASSSSAGKGTYMKDGRVIAAILGTVISDRSTSAQRPELNIVPKGNKASDYVVRIGDIVLCKVARSNYNQAFVDILMIGDLYLPFPVKAVIRREDIREKEIDKIIVPDILKPRDVVRAVVISLGDTKSYFLSIARPGCGVIVPMRVDETEVA